MSTSGSSGIKRGQTIAFRVPSDTPDHVMKQLQKLKETEKRNFSSKMAEFVIQGVSNTLSRERETITIPLPQSLNKSQRDWLKHEHSEALLGSIIYQLITDPVRSSSLLAALNSKATDIDQALYLQEDSEQSLSIQSGLEDNKVEESQSVDQQSEESEIAPLNEFGDDLDNFNWEVAKVKTSAAEDEEEIEESIDDLLGDFLAHMNK